MNRLLRPCARFALPSLLAAPAVGPTRRRDDDHFNARRRLVARRPARSAIATTPAIALIGGSASDAPGVRRSRFAPRQRTTSSIAEVAEQPVVTRRWFTGNAIYDFSTGPSDASSFRTRSAASASTARASPIRLRHRQRNRTSAGISAAAFASR